MKILVITEYPSLVRAIRKAGHDPVVLCPGCGAQLEEREQGEVFVCTKCAVLATEEDINEVLRRRGLL